MFSPNVANFPKPRPRRPISDDDDDDDEPGQQPSSLIRRLMFTTQNCMTPGRALKRPRAHSESVKVYLRIRPSDSQTIEVKDHESLCMRNPQTGTTNSYKFTRVFDANTSQSKLFSETTVPLIDSLFEGYNALIFAYGITNSGKTYSILGTQIEPGILPKTIQYLFESIRQSGRDLDVYASYLEVHNDILIDLLPAEAQSKTLSLIANKTGHSFIKGLREVKIENVNDAELVLEEGTKHRKCAQTALNTASSRSHALFSLKLVRPGTNKDTEGIVSKLCIVDLAGAERTSRAKNADEHRCRETNNINKSLMQLGRCLEVVRWNQTHPDSKPRPVPWRDSKISRLFKDYLVGGWGRAVMIATVNPDPTDHDETCHALRFAALTSEVESVSKIDHGQNLNLSCESNDGSQDSPDREEELLEEIYHLKLQLLDCERRRCATEAETRNAVCNELQLQAQKRESEFRVQLEEAEERARIRAEKRFNIWKRNMISGSDSTVDIDGVFQIAKQKAEADVERQLSKLRSQCETYEVIIKQHESKTIDLQSQLETLTSKTIQNAQSQVEELEKKLEIALREISEMEISLEEQKTLNSALKENIVDLKQKKSELEFAVKEAEKRAASADKKEKRSEIIQNKASSLEKKITSLSSVIEQLEQDVSVKTTKIVDYEESLKAASSKELQLSQDLVKLQNEAKIQLEKQSELEKTISNLASLSASQGSIANRLGTENDELRQKIAQADADRVQLLASSSQLQNELEQLRLTIQKLQDSHSDDDSKLELLRESNGLLTRKVELLQDGKRELESKNSSLAEELALCRQELVKELSNVSSVKAENISLHEDLKSLQKTLSETQERVLQLDESESTSAKVMHEENCLLKNQLSSLRKEKAWQLKDLQKKINQLESSSKKQEGKFEKEKMSLQSSLDDVRHNYDKAVSEINDLKSSLNSAEMSTRDLESQIETMRVQHQTSKASETEEKEQLVEMLQKQISELTTELDHQSKENTRLLKDIDDVRSSMQSQIDSLCSEHDIQKKLSQELSSQLLQLSTEKQNLENDVVNSGSQNKSLQDKIEMLENEIETMRTSIAEKKNIEKENKQLQKKLTSLEFQLNKKSRATKQQVALTERISQLELEAAKYADSLTEIEELQQHIELAKANEARLKELAVENERLRQRIQDYDLAAKKRQQIEIQKQELERQLAQLESSNHDITKSSAVDLKLADDISQSTPISRKPVLVDSSNKQMESSKPLKIVSASDQENVAVSRMFGKRSRAALEENLKWSSILTSDPFDNVAQKAKESPQPKRKPARKPNKEVADSKSVPKRSTRAGR